MSIEGERSDLVLKLEGHPAALDVKVDGGAIVASKQDAKVERQGARARLTASDRSGGPPVAVSLRQGLVRLVD